MSDVSPEVFHACDTVHAYSGTKPMHEGKMCVWCKQLVSQLTLMQTRPSTQSHMQCRASFGLTCILFSSIPVLDAICSLRELSG